MGRGARWLRGVQPRPAGAGSGGGSCRALGLRCAGCRGAALEVFEARVSSSLFGLMPSALLRAGVGPGDLRESLLTQFDV